MTRLRLTSEGTPVIQDIRGASTTMNESIFRSSLRVKPVLWALLVAEAAFVVWLRQPWLIPDSQDYLAMAAGNLSLAGLRAPGYPLFLAALVHVPPTLIIVIQMALYLASVWLFSRYVFEKGRTIFLMIAAIYVFPLFYVAAIASEANAIFLFASATVLAMNRRWVLSGIALGCAVLTRPDLLPAVLALPLAAWAYDKGKAGLLTLAGSFLILAPYMVWNTATFGRPSPIPVNSTIGLSLYLASWESRVGYDELQSVHAKAQPTRLAIESGLTAELVKIRDAGGTDKEFRDAAFRRMAADPLDTALHSIKAVWRLFNTQRYPVPPSIALGLGMISTIVWLLGMIGMALYARGKLIIPAALFWAVLVGHLPLHTEARYTALLRLILMVFAALSVQALLGKVAGSGLSEMKLPANRKPAGDGLAN